MQIQVKQAPPNSELHFCRFFWSVFKPTCPVCRRWGRGVRGATRLNIVPADLISLQIQPKYRAFLTQYVTRCARAPMIVNKLTIRGLMLYGTLISTSVTANLHASRS